jgi:putative (di)nucleoside polyphosphate hydrolase
MTAAHDPSLYRPGVGLVLINRLGLVFAGRRADVPDAWQMPQGGIDRGETPEAAALRELHEEVGTDRATILARTADWLFYDLPPDIAARAWGGGYRGQRQIWFALRFTGEDSDISIATAAEPEFVTWRWMTADELLRQIVAFKRPVYDEVFREFASHLKPASR